MNNESLFNDARSLLAGGVNSPIRAIRPYPFFTDHAAGAYLWDVEGTRYCDYCLAYGPLLLGHADPDVVQKVSEQLKKGTTYGTPTTLEVEYAAKVCELSPNTEMIRAVNSGTEATMAALRLARAIAGRDEIATLAGGYHGSHDGVLTKRSQGGTAASSKGVTSSQVCGTRIVEFNDIEALEQTLEDRKAAAFILEPIMGNIGCIPPEKQYLKEVRKVCDETGTLLIFDETITGFRVAKGGAQEHFGVDADIVTYGKVAGGGLPIGVIASSKENMEHFAPAGDVYNAGTFSGNPLSMAAGLAALEKISSTSALKKMHESHSMLVEGIEDMLSDNAVVQSAPGMFQIYFGCEEVQNSFQAHQADASTFRRFWETMLKEGYFLPPSQFESNFVSTCHDDKIIGETLEALGRAIR